MDPGDCTDLLQCFHPGRRYDIRHPGGHIPPGTNSVAGLVRKFLMGFCGRERKTAVEDLQVHATCV
jgi:hypothetical protein